MSKKPSKNYSITALMPIPPRIRPTHIITRRDGSTFEVNANAETAARWKHLGFKIEPITSDWSGE